MRQGQEVERETVISTSHHSQHCEEGYPRTRDYEPLFLFA